MSMIRVENLTFSYPSSYDTIFDNTTFQIDPDWELGFIGRGKIISSVQFDYFPDSVSAKKRMTEGLLDAMSLLSLLRK